MGHICSTNTTKGKKPAILYEIPDLQVPKALEQIIPDGRQLPEIPISQKKTPRFNVPKLLHSKATIDPKLYKKRHQRNQILKYTELEAKYFDILTHHNDSLKRCRRSQ